MRLNPMLQLALPLALLACGPTSDDPADGGLRSGIKNLTDGTYQERIEERETAIEAQQAETTALEGARDDVAAETAAVEAQIARTETDLANAKREVLRLRAALQNRGREIPPEVEAKVVEVTLAKAEEDDPAARLASLKATLADARAVAEALADISG
ncbi:MAG: hypothetical protein AAGC92_07225 [Pseudomonadota bacterium]